MVAFFCYQINFSMIFYCSAQPVNAIKSAKNKGGCMVGLDTFSALSFSDAIR